MMVYCLISGHRLSPGLRPFNMQHYYWPHTWLAWILMAGYRLYTAKYKLCGKRKRETNAKRHARRYVRESMSVLCNHVWDLRANFPTNITETLTQISSWKILHKSGRLKQVRTYTVSQKKYTPWLFTIGLTFAKSMRTDFQNSFTGWFVGKLYTYKHKHLHLTCNVLQHYFVKVENPKYNRIFVLNVTINTLN